MKKKYRLFWVILFFASEKLKAQQPEMFFGDTTRLGRPLAKDPKVVYFNNMYRMYYSIPENKTQGWGIGIAISSDLIHWTKAGEMERQESYEAKGICAPGAIVRDGKLHLFYQTYGNGKDDAICHAISDDGLYFTRNPTNPVFKPSGDWTKGRAIDAEVVLFNGKYFLYFASRDTSYQYQMQGVASTSLHSHFNRNEWTQLNKEAAIYLPHCRGKRSALKLPVAQ